MANMIELASSYQAIVDLIYKEDSRTAGIDTAVQPDFTNTPEVKYLHISTQGFGNYDRNNGFSKSDVTTEWRTFRLEIERGLEVNVDRMDNEETLNQTFGTVVGNITREHMIPELDAYRFAKYASTPGVLSGTPGALTAANIVSAVDEGVRAMNADEVTQEGRIMFVNSDLQVTLNQALNRQWGSEDTVNTVLNGYNNMSIVYVPPRRFFTEISLNPGVNSWGYTPTGDPINFIIIQPNAIVQTVKLMVPKIFSPDVNQDLDTWKYQFRLYHDCFIYENKLSGVYVHQQGAI